VLFDNDSGSVELAEFFVDLFSHQSDDLPIDAVACAAGALR